MSVTNYSVRIIGTDEQASSETPTTTALAALAGYTYKDVSAFRFNPGINMEGNSYSGVNKNKYINNSFRYTFSIELRERSFFSGTSFKTLANLFDIVTPLKKPYTYIYSSNFELEIAPANSARRVVLTEIAPKQAKGNIFIVLGFEVGAII